MIQRSASDLVADVYTLAIAANLSMEICLTGLISHTTKRAPTNSYLYIRSKKNVLVLLVRGKKSCTVRAAESFHRTLSFQGLAEDEVTIYFNLSKSLGFECMVSSEIIHKYMNNLIL